MSALDIDEAGYMSSAFPRIRFWRQVSLNGHQPIRAEAVRHVLRDRDDPAEACRTPLFHAVGELREWLPRFLGIQCFSRMSSARYSWASDGLSRYPVERDAQWKQFGSWKW